MKKKIKEKDYLKEYINSHTTSSHLSHSLTPKKRGISYFFEIKGDNGELFSTFF